MTGKHPGHAWVRDNGNPPERKDEEYPGQHPLPDGEVTIAEMLKAAGYATGAMGKWGLGYEGSSGAPNRQGFDLFYGYLCQVQAHWHWPRFLWRNDVREPLPGNDPLAVTSKTYAQDRFTEEAVAFVRAHRDRPFFLYLPFIIPHVSIQVPDEALAEYRGKLPEEPYEDRRRHYTVHPAPRAGYAAMVSTMDRAIGRLLEELDALALANDTVVFFTSDNGPVGGRTGGADAVFFGSAAGLRGFKGSLYEGGIRTPMIVRWPGKIAAGAVTHHVSAFWDVMATLADLTGAPPPPGTDGVSFAPTLLGRPEAQRRHEHLYWEFPAYGGQQAVRLGDFKAVRQRMLDRANPDPLRIELYDLARDPGEKNDVSAAHPDVVARAARIMKEARVPSALFRFPVLDGP
jgi:arylsulfatase